MNWTDNKAKKNQKIIEKFYNSKLLPAAKAINEPDRWFQPGKDDSLDTYWQKATGDTSFQVSELNLENLEEVLSELWNDENELKDLAPAISVLSKKLKCEEAADEISPFIYAMF